MVNKVFHPIGRPGHPLGMELHHDLLVEGPDLAICIAKIQRFFGEYQLVRYAEVTIEEETVIPATSPNFWTRLGEGLEKNRLCLASLLDELRLEGYEKINDLTRVPLGYQSKNLHTIAHLLDGFFGIDSAFYNLAEDSHAISEDLRSRIASRPERFWLLRLKAVT